MSICNSCGMSGMAPDGCGAPRCPFGVHRAEHPQTTIARLTRENEALRSERDEALAKVAAAWNAAASITRPSGSYLVPGRVGLPFGWSADIRALAAADPDATAALNRVRAGAMREAARCQPTYILEDPEDAYGVNDVPYVSQQAILARADEIEKGL